MRTAHPPLATVAGASARIAAVTPIRVAIVDNCPDVRFLLATIIELDGRFEVVAEASDGKSTRASVAATDPDAVLVDLRLGADSGTAVIRDLRQRGATACIVVVTGSTAPHDHVAAFDAGADAIQSKRSMTSTMVDELAELVARHASTSPVPRDTDGRRTRARVAPLASAGGGHAALADIERDLWVPHAVIADIDVRTNDPSGPPVGSAEGR